MKTILALFATTCLMLLLAGEPASAQHEGPAMNYLRIDERLATGGHLTDDGLAELKSQGIAVVVDLRDRPPEGYGERLRAEGIEWINVPVVWRSPRVEDYEQFRATMQRHEDAHVLVQCQANYRASAMTYLYRVLEDGVSEAEARESMSAVWTAEGRWARYLEEVRARFAE